MPMLPDLDDNNTSVLRQECTYWECSWRMKILKVNKIELPKLRVGFILLWKTRVQAGATLFIEKGSKWSKNELFSLIVYMKFGCPSRSSYSAVYYFRSVHSINLFPLRQMWQFWLTACATWKALFFKSFIDTLWLFLVRNWVIPLALFGYEMIVANSCERVLKTSCLIALVLVETALLGLQILKNPESADPPELLLHRSVTRLRVILILPGNFKS